MRSKRCLREILEKKEVNEPFKNNDQNLFYEKKRCMSKTRKRQDVYEQKS